MRSQGEDRGPRPLAQELVRTVVVGVVLWAALVVWYLGSGRAVGEAARESGSYVLIGAASWLTAGLVFDRLLPWLTRRLRRTEET